MKVIYNKMLTLLSQIPELKWIDMDKGQLEYFEQPPVQFPCALLNIELPKCEDIGGADQLCNCLITIRLAFNYTGETANVMNQARRDASLQYFDIVEKVYQKLQGYGDAEINELSRKGVFQERRPDSFKVTVLKFATSFEDQTASV